MTPHRDLITRDGRPVPSAIFRRAWECARREAALWNQVGHPRPVQEIFAETLRNTWDWVRALQNGTAWGTLYRP